MKKLITVTMALMLVMTFCFPLTASAEKSPTGGTVPAYHITEGMNGVWNRDNNNGTGLVFKTDGDISKFVGVKVDGKTLSAEDYQVEGGMVIITLKEDYLKTLSLGRHKLTAVFSDGECSTFFYITKDGTANEQTGNSSAITEDGAVNIQVVNPSATSPKTGDMDVFPYSLGVAAFVLAVGAALIRKKAI